MEKTLTRTGKLIAAAACCCVFVLIILVIAVSGRNKGYRDITIFELSGDAAVWRDGESLSAYEDMKLENGDRLLTGTDSLLCLKLDEDKFVTLEQESELFLSATGNAADSRTELTLVAGSILNEIDNKLSSGSTYKITTPTSVMAVRGTAFYVSLTKESDQVYATELAVLDGTVSMTPPDSEDEILVDAGFAAAMQGSGTDISFLYQNEPVDFNTLPDFVQERIRERVENGDWDKIAAAYSAASEDANTDASPRKEDVAPVAAASSQTEDGITSAKEPEKTDTELPAEDSENGGGKKIAAESKKAAAGTQSAAAAGKTGAAAVPAATATSTAETPATGTPAASTDTQPVPEPAPAESGTPATESPLPDTLSPRVFSVTFLDEHGQLFASQYVGENKTVSRPLFSPGTGSTWYLGDTPYDFSTPVTENLTLIYAQ